MFRNDGPVDEGSADEAVEVLARVHRLVHAVEKRGGGQDTAFGEADVRRVALKTSRNNWSKIDWLKFKKMVYGPQVSPAGFGDEPKGPPGLGDGKEVC